MPKELWEVKYRPKTLDEYVFKNEKHKADIQKYIEDGSIPHLMLTGHAGTGKTALAYLLKDLLKIDESDFLFVDGTTQNGIDHVRNQIFGFIQTYSTSVHKLVFIDEADYLTKDAQGCLRSMMLEYSDNARFILACNYANKIIPALHSRCVQFVFKSLNEDDVYLRVGQLLTNEKVKAKYDVLSQYVDAYYPDLRKIIQSVQNNVVNGVLQPLQEVDSSTEIHMKIVDMMEKNSYNKIREIISGNLSDDDWHSMYRFLYENLDGIGKFENPDKWKAGIIIIADHLYRHTTVADMEINATAMFLRLGDL